MIWEFVWGLVILLTGVWIWHKGRQHGRREAQAMLLSIVSNNTEELIEGIHAALIAMREQEQRQERSKYN